MKLMSQNSSKLKVYLLLFFEKNILQNEEMGNVNEDIRKKLTCHE